MGDWTFTSPPGKHYVIAHQLPKEQLPPAVQQDIASVKEGDLLELLAMHDGWGYVRRFKEDEEGSGSRSEGVVRLEWIFGVHLVFQDGKRRAIEVDVHSPDYGFQSSRATDAASRLRVKRYLKKIDDVSQLWQSTASPSRSTASDKSDLPARDLDVKAAQQGSALEKELASETARKKKSKQQRKESEQQQPKQGTDFHREACSSSSQSAPEMENAECAAGHHLEADALMAEPKKKAGRSPGASLWYAQWEREAAHLENLLLASSSGIECVDEIGRAHV